MSIEHAHQAIRDVLVNDAAVTAITGTVTPWQLWRTDELPAVTYTRIFRDGEWTYDGALGFKSANYQFSCWSNDYDEAQNLAEAVSDALDGYNDQQHGNVYVHSTRIDDMSDLNSDPPGGAEQPPFGVRVDVAINYERTD